IEYTVDIMCDFGGNPIFITPRIREAVRAGEVLKTRIVNDPVIVDEMKKLIEAFKPCGPITVQLIKDRSTGIDHYIEINPRYGGGAPLSIKAGADSAEAIIRLLNGENLSFRDNAAAVDAVYSRFDQSVCITPSNQMSIRGVIFDLDDTLYPERQYVQSGYRLIAEYLGDASYAGRLMKYFEDGKQAVDELLAEIGRPEEKEKCIDIYREQIPDIRLYPGVSELITSLKDKGIKVGIVTDGRVNGQRNKLQALGLDSLIGDENIMITDELGGVQFRKPCDIAFRILQNRWRIPAGQIVYIGDNIAKDMQAPMQLGMQFIYYKNADGIYPRTGSVIDVPVITDISELKL
ncbi:MAG: ATP-grasp domain-containing protein, partial [Lachnospiraceae bacterium]|nr:ATP-grasp domain-containing protein [Lachnospiraceae bacterium]